MVDAQVTMAVSILSVMVIHPPLATARLRLERVGTTGARQLVLSQADLMRITLVCVFLG